MRNAKPRKKATCSRTELAMKPGPCLTAQSSTLKTERNSRWGPYATKYPKYLDTWDPIASHFSLPCSHKGPFGGRGRESQNMRRQRFSHTLEASDILNRNFIEVRKAV